MKKQFTERSVYGGISEDDKLKANAQILYSENVDLTTNTDYYTVSQEPSVNQITANSVVNIFEANGTVFFCDNGSNLYRNGNAIPVWGSAKIYNTWTTSTYLYIFTSTEHIFRILLSNVLQDDWTTYITDMDSITATSSPGKQFVISDEDNAYISVDKTVYKIDNTTGLFVGSNIFTIDSDVVGMSETESNLQIFTENGKYIIRDKVAGGDVRTKDLGVKIGLVKSVGSDNYIISGGAIYILNGYKLEQVLSDPYSDVLDSTKYNINSINNNQIAFLEGMFYLGIAGAPDGLSTPLNEFTFGGNALLTYGVKKQGLPPSRNIFINNINGVKIESIDVLYTYIQPNSSVAKKLYIGYEDVNGNFGLASIRLGDVSSGGPSDDGIIIYNTFDGGIKEAQKSLLRIKIRAEIFNADDEIYLCTLDNNGNLEWFNSTKTDSLVQLSNLGDDGYLYFTPEGDRQFYNFTPALILHNDGNYTRREGVRVYSLTYEYDFTRQG